MEFFDQGSSSRLPDMLPQFDRLPADLTLDVVECTDTLDRFSGNG
jgi:hypothetical protein